jgi:type IV fimbrial biogenesis protein FimT
MATKHRDNPVQRRRDAGLSLLEVLVVVAITAIVAATVAPSFAALFDARRLESAATRLAADLQFTRSEAIARNRPLQLSIVSGADASCWIVHTGAPADCRCGAEAGGVCGGSARAVKSVALPVRERVGLAANVSTIVFDPLHGTSTPTGTLRLIGPSGAVHHVVNVVGRVRSCSPLGAVAGYPAC